MKGLFAVWSKIFEKHVFYKEKNYKVPFSLYISNFLKIANCPYKKTRQNENRRFWAYL
jgi:hypothetical protein